MNHRFVASFLASVAVCVTTSVPALAQKWKIEYSWAGKSVVTKTDAPTVTMEWKEDGGNDSVESSQGYGSMSAVSSGMVTFTGTWNPEDSGQPTPPEVYLIIAGGASAETRQEFAPKGQGAYPTYRASASVSVPNTVTVRDPVVPPPMPTGQAETVTQSPNKTSWEKIGTSGGTFEKIINVSSG